MRLFVNMQYNEVLITTVNGIIKNQILEVTYLIRLYGCNLKEKLDWANGIHKGTI